MGHYTLARRRAATSCYVLIIQGVAFSCLFIPLTTIALSSHPAAPAGRRHGTQFAAAPDRRLDRTGGLRHAAHALRDAQRAATCCRTSRAAPAMAARWPAMQRMLQAAASTPARAPGCRAHDRRQLRQQAMVLSFEKLFYLAGICSSAFCRWSSCCAAPEHAREDRSSCGDVNDDRLKPKPARCRRSPTTSRRSLVQGETPLPHPRRVVVLLLHRLRHLRDPLRRQGIDRRRAGRGRHRSGRRARRRTGHRRPHHGEPAGASRAIRSPSSIRATRR